MKLALPPSPPKSTRVWSLQQQAIFSAIETRLTSHASNSNLIVNAVAGSGKTTTLVEACKRMSGQVAFAAYNKKIADEIKVRVAEFGNVNAGTFHSFGFAAWRAANEGKILKVEGGKLRILASQLGQSWELRKFTTLATAHAKQAMLEPGDPDELYFDVFDWHDVWDELGAEFTQSEGMDGVRQLLSASIIESTKLIDFDDMLYMPLIRDCKFPQYDWVLIDEAQDSNRVRRQVAARMLRPGGRLVAVGDPHQAIYGFTGADNNALDILRRDFACLDMPLTVSYRCPRAVVAHAQEYVSHIQAAPEAIEGSVETIDQIRFWRNESKQLLKDDAILCRNTKPLIDLAFELIRNDLGCHVEGREIGESLIKLVDKFPRARNLDDLRDSLVEYKRNEVDRLLAVHQEAKAAGIEDRVDTLLVVIENLDGKGDAMEVKLKLSILFGDTTPGQPSPSTTLATIHKSKGREWNRVFIWGANKFQPSPFAKKDWQKEQENNLRYVSVTRAKQRLVEVNVL